MKSRLKQGRARLEVPRLENRFHVPIYGIQPIQNVGRHGNVAHDVTNAAENVDGRRSLIAYGRVAVYPSHVPLCCT